MAAEAQAATGPAGLGCAEGTLQLTVEVDEKGLPPHVAPLHPSSIPDGSEAVPASLLSAAAAVMAEPDVYAKARLTFVACAAFARGDLPLLPADEEAAKALVAPDAPARPSWVTTVPPAKMNSGGKKGMVHSVVHAESYAIDLSWDIMLRFGVKEGKLVLPEAFFTDWARVSETTTKRSATMS